MPAQPLFTAARPSLSPSNAWRRRAAAIDDQHAAAAGALHGFLHSRVVFETTDRADRPMKCAPSAERMKQGLAHLHLVAVVVAQVGSALGQGRSCRSSSSSPGPVTTRAGIIRAARTAPAVGVARRNAGGAGMPRIPARLFMHCIVESVSRVTGSRSAAAAVPLPCCFGMWMAITPSRHSARMPCSSAFSGSAKRRANVP